MKKRNHVILASLAAAVMMQPCAFAADVVYTWSGGAHDNQWIRFGTGKPENWVEGVVPTNGDPVDADPNDGVTDRNVFRFADDMWTNGKSIVTIDIRTSTDPNVGNIRFDKTGFGINLRLYWSGTNGAYLDMAPGYNGAETLTVLTNNNSITTRNATTASPATIRLYSFAQQEWRIGATAASTDISFTVDAPIEGSSTNRGFTKTGGGTLILSQDSTFAGAMIAAEGTIQVSSLRNTGLASAAGTGTNTSTLQISQTTATERRNGALVYTGGDTTTNRVIGLDNTTFGSSPLTARLENANANSTLTLTGGIYELASVSGSRIDFSIGGAGRINVNSDGIWGNINIIKTGTGTVAINADSEWEGNVTVKQGRLLMNIEQFTGGNWHVENGGTLGGTGRTNTSIIVDAGGKIRPGADDAGNFTVGGNVDLNGTLEIFINSSGTASQLIANGITLGDTAGIDVVCDQTLALGTSFLVANANALTGEFSNLDENGIFVAGLNAFKVSYLAAAGDILLTVVEAPAQVPEPATLAMMGSAGTLLLMRRRNRR